MYINNITRLYAPTLLILATSLTSCLSIQPLEFKRVDHLVVNKVNDEEQIKFNVIGYNTNRKNFKISDLKTRVTVDGHAFAELQSDSVISIIKESDFSIPVSATASEKDFQHIISSGLALFLSGNKIPVEVKGNFVVRKFIFRKKFHFQLIENIDATMLNGLY